MLTEKNSHFDFTGNESHAMSMSDAQSVSNLANQLALEIEDRYKNLNNSSSKFLLESLGYTPKELVKQRAVALPSDEKVLEDLRKKGMLHALQGFLVEHIKLKEDSIETITKAKTNYRALTVNELREKGYEIPTLPKRPEYKDGGIRSITEEEYIANLNPDEYLKYLIDTSAAAHIGQFIHDRGVLHKLRKSISTEEELSEYVMKDKRVAILTHHFHHTPQQLTNLHAKLANEHRDLTRKVNRIKSIAKSAVTERNAEVQRDTHAALLAHQEEMRKFRIIEDEYADALHKANEEIRLAKYAELDTDLQRWLKAKIRIPNVFADIVKELKG